MIFCNKQIIDAQAGLLLCRLQTQKNRFSHFLTLMFKEPLVISYK